MDILFVFVAVCPALLITGYETRNQEPSWQAWIGKASTWFFVITFVNLFLLYLSGWGDYDFTAMSVQFLVQYMSGSMVIIGVVKLAKWAVNHMEEGGRDV